MYINLYKVDSIHILHVCVVADPILSNVNYHRARNLF